MNKGFRVVLNLLVFFLIIGFVWYMVHSLGKNETVFGSDSKTEMQSPYKKVHALKVKSEIVSFDISDNQLFIATHQSVLIYSLTGDRLKEIPVGKEIRDLKVADRLIYLLYPSEIDVLSFDGTRITGWGSHRANANYNAMALSDDCIFVTDAGNKNICKYTKEGEFVAIILSPNGFVIPSYAFDIINVKDTIYCTNSGRHKIESYSLEGEYLASFGMSGSDIGRFAGCCNPVYLASTTQGDLLTSEKGNPRISCFSRDGRFKAILLNSKALGGGTKACRVKVLNDKMVVAGKNVLSTFVYDPRLAIQSPCAGCPTDCPLKN